MRAAAAVVGRATGTRDMQPLDPRHLVDRVDAVLLTGGSAYGLDAAAGVMRWMEERGRGFPVGADGVVPIVPAAVVFDLAPLGRFDARPTAAMAYEACEGARSAPIAEGSVGAGAGTTVGKGAGVEHAMKGGVGVALAGDGDTAVGAVAVVNAFGDVRDAEGRILAGARAAGGHFLDSAALVAGGRGRERFADAAAMRNTTLAVVATSAPLSRLELAQVAQAATAAFYRRITPAGTSFDGDVVFAVAALESGDGTGRSPGSAFGTGGPLRSAQGRLPHRDVRSGDDSTHHPSPAALPQSPLTAADLMRFEQLAVRALEDAIERAVRLARGRDGIPGLADSSAAS
jgi:L-aminopeptidase/D-esterase-like protein